MAVWRGPRSLQGRATLITVLIFALVLGIGVLAMSAGLRYKALGTVTDNASQAARVAVREVRRGLPDGIIPTNTVGRLQAVDRAGRVVAASPMMRGMPPISRVWPGPDDTRVVDEPCVTVPGAGRTCFVVVGLQGSFSPHGDVMVYAAEQRPPLLVGHTLEGVLTAFCLVLLGLVGWGTWWLVGRALEPVRRMRAEMAEIAASGLSHRIAVPASGSELNTLIESINRTLDRLEHAREMERRFASDASHELRTPLTGLRTKLELALADPEDEDSALTMRSALKDTERLQAVIDDLLTLARLDAGARPEPRRVDLAELVTGEMEQRPSRHEVLMRLHPGVVVRGDRLQLSRVLTNLLANAERHAAGMIEVNVCQNGDDAVLEVVDDGQGVPEADRERIFQRFTRLDTARSREAGGTGLGLSIAREIATAHGGRLYATDRLRGEGARFVLRLPLSGDVEMPPGGTGDAHRPGKPGRARRG
ncbi:HAMP domain-containing sensor histidine kinase [Streptosporangium sandarakinum]|uniref:histidine kinase n=1 Tax=Streptosporangium sandarakinum TaxID=1260955 RepID=A0A852V1U5_9ACTN|nr:HAMP domain-containing sensor histidine kinase [Streptosporangium sandarakinum]NYF41214.1 signal transduction histidine kinase [Streptosporangium sandarakinum]